MALVAAFHELEIPKEPRGRYHRFVIDVDMDAVREYVLGAGTSIQPWPGVVIDEMVELLTEWASTGAVSSSYFKGIDP